MIYALSYRRLLAMAACSGSFHAFAAPIFRMPRRRHERYDDHMGRRTTAKCRSRLKSFIARVRGRYNLLVKRQKI